MPVPTNVALKAPDAFKLIGTPAKRLDASAKVNGTAMYGIDARPPGIKFATLAQSPVFGGRLKSLDDTAAKGRFNDVGDEVFFAELLDFDFAFFCQRVLGRNDESELVLQNFGRLKLRIARDKRNRAEIEAVVDHFVGNIAGEHAMKADLNARVGFSEVSQGGKESMDGALVDAEGEFAALEALEVHQAFLDFVAQVEEALGVFAKEGAGVGEADGARAADEEGLAEGFFELADGQADRGLRAVKAFGGAREAALAGDGQKDLEFSEIHGSSPANTCSSGQASRRSVEILRRTKRSSG